MTQMFGAACRAGLSAVVLACAAASQAHAGFVLSTLNSLNVNSTMSGSGKTWHLEESQTITDSQTADLRFVRALSSASYAPPGYGNSLVVYTYRASKPSYYSGGSIDSLILRHDLGSSMINTWNAFGSVNVTFSTAIQFFSDTYVGSSWSFGGSTITNGTRFEAGTYTINYASAYTYSSGLTREWDCVAYFAPAAVPSPGAAALLGAAGLLGRRRRA